MASKRRNMFYQNKKQETTETGSARLDIPEIIILYADKEIALIETGVELIVKFYLRLLSGHAFHEGVNRCIKLADPFNLSMMIKRGNGNESAFRVIFVDLFILRRPTPVGQVGQVSSRVSSHFPDPDTLSHAAESGIPAWNCAEQPGNNAPQIDEIGKDLILSLVAKTLLLEQVTNPRGGFKGRGHDDRALRFRGHFVGVLSFPEWTASEEKDFRRKSVQHVEKAQGPQRQASKAAVSKSRTVSAATAPKPPPIPLRVIGRSESFLKRYEPVDDLTLTAPGEGVAKGSTHRPCSRARSLLNAQTEPNNYPLSNYAQL
ncbi:hypothetical protein AAG570_006545 [Ranatra chinensis]|uniref:Uncharacterized protein n=1 Tax=Ranatra chinensis TaxID=642074 RepID=A0ABD0YUA6_9HEMI